MAYRETSKSIMSIDGDLQADTSIFHFFHWSSAF